MDVEADLTGANLNGANLFATQMARARRSLGSALPRTLPAQACSGSIAGANLGAIAQPVDGPMRAVLKSANLSE
jgi:uncharacterized protein YjbI with pentapeptide repeats